MSVFTPLSRDELEAFLEPYRLGRLHAFAGIPEGAENSNFRLATDAGNFVLTLVERGSREQIGFVVELLERLAAAGLPVPHALADGNGERLHELAGKPALLQPWLSGQHVLDPHAQHCTLVGRLLGQLHQVTHADPLPRPDERGLAWMLEEGALMAVSLEGAELALLRQALSEAATLPTVLDQLPVANLHADLFRDNLLFDGMQISGVLDFHNACSGPMLYDLAVAANDWCTRDDGALEPHRLQALLAGYGAIRRFTAAEAQHWPQLLRLACLRFWLSRLIAQREASGEAVLIKDPKEFQRRLATRQQESPALPFAL